MNKPLWSKEAGHRGERGFSLIELMIVLLVLAIMMAAVFQQISLVQQRSAAEQVKLDIFQESRAFMDQLTRDLHQAGYPNPRNFAPAYISGPNDQHAAVGLVSVSSNKLIFEGDVDGDGVVDSVQYYLDATGTGCPCMRRSQVPKTAADPMSQGLAPTANTLSVETVQNGSSSNPIFEAYDINGNLITLPVDFDTNPTTMAQIRSIKVTMTVQATQADIQTRQRPITTLVSSVDLNNCSQAATTQTMSCN